MIVTYILFGLAVLWVAYVYIGYASALSFLGLIYSRRYAAREDFFPSVSVLISARNEEKDIAWKIEETLAWNYPREKLEILVASDASEDRTDEILASYRTPRLKFVRLQSRGGKNRALNHLAQLARGDLLFFTDANSHIDAEAVHRMVRWFADEKVGCVTGWERTIHEGETGEVMATGGDTYLGHESWVNTLESRLGSVLVCDGSIFCIRRKLYSPVDPELANDLELPLRIGARGFALLYEPAAASLEKATTSFKEEFNRRRRICGQGIVGMWRLRRYLRGLRAWQFFSRKLLRWLTFVPLAMLLITSGVLAHNPLFLVLFVGQIGLYLLALVGWAFARRGRQAGRLVSLPFYFVLLNAAAITGILQALRGRRFAVWQSPGLSRGGAVSAGAATAVAPAAHPVMERSQHSRRPACMFSVDVEDWFHILDVPSAPSLEQWDLLPSRVEANFYRLLNLFHEHDVRVTCFFLGWIAQRFPHLVRAADECGHEIASHGYSHRLVYQMDRRAFLDDVATAKNVLEQTCGRRVLGYRAPGFSVVKNVPWFFETLAEAGYVYDSSVFPGTRGHGGMKDAHHDPYCVSTPNGSLVEFPITVTELLGKSICFFGGGYLRLVPYRVVKSMANRVLGDGRPVVFYIHPREIDPQHPRLPMNFVRRFKTYVNLATTEPKLNRLLDEFEVMPLRSYMEAHFADVLPHEAVDARVAANTAAAHTGGVL